MEPEKDNDTEDLSKKLDKYKPKKKKMAIPVEFLENANSYDDKLIVVKAITEKEIKKVVRIVQGMLEKKK